MSFFFLYFNFGQSLWYSFFFKQTIFYKNYLFFSLILKNQQKIQILFNKLLYTHMPSYSKKTNFLCVLIKLGENLKKGNYLI